VKVITGGDYVEVSAWATVAQAAVACVALYVAITAKNIASKQNENLRSQVNLQLYEKRYKIYETTAKFIATILSEGLENSTIDTISLMRETKEARFLMGDDITDFLDELYKKCNSLHAFVSVKHTDTEEWHSKLDQYRDYLTNELNKLPTRFDKYLNFQNINVGND
jgi:glycerol-3-phosphate cytidylyltransferase-like family protein